jgi:putative ABC transport system permease protein
MILLRLAISNFLVRKVRTALTVGAIALSVSLVVAVTSGYKSIEGAAVKFLNQYMGSADAYIVSVNPSSPQIPETLVQSVSSDPAVRLVVGRLESASQLSRAADQIKPMAHPERQLAGAPPPDKIWVGIVGVRKPQDTTTDSLSVTDGKWFDTATGNWAVVDQIAQEKLGVGVGNTISIPSIDSRLDLVIVGVVHKPTFIAQRTPTIYLPMETFQHFTGQDHPPQVSRLNINLRADANFDAFKSRWTARLASIDNNLRLHMRRDNAGDLENKLRGVHILSYLGGAVAMLTAMFIVFSALSMGVTERQRTLAMLRAVGAERRQVFWLVVLEGLALAVAGIAVGVPLGMLWIKLLYLKFSDMFLAGVLFSHGGMIYAAGGSMLTALAASLLPAWWASRVSPLDAMNVWTPRSAAPPWRWALLGAAMVCIDPFFAFGPLEKWFARAGASDPDALAQSVRFFAHFAVGLPGVMLGYFLLAPLFVWAIEKVIAPVAAGALRVKLTLLRQQLSTGIWRAAGTAAALMVGLATLVALQIQGHTLIGGWQLPDKFPDIFIWSPNLLSWADQKKLAAVPGIAPGQLMPVVVTTPAGDSSPAMLLAKKALFGQGLGVMFFGIDPDQAVHMVGLEYRDDNGIPYPQDQQPAIEARALAEMKKGRRIIVTDEFRQANHLKIGEQYIIQTPVNGPQAYTIAEIVWSPGADVFISMFDLGRLLDQPTAGSVFGTLDDAKRDFGVTGTWFFAANLEGGVQKETLLKNVQKELGDRGLAAGDVRQIKYGIESTFYRLLNLISTVAIAAMAVASLGVTNTVMASVRSRLWHFGILRGVGLLRGELLRLVMAEAALLGAVGIVLGMFAGIEIALDAHQLVHMFLGYSPHVVIPWRILAGGCAAVMVVAMIASLWPALSVAYTQPLELLQAGRAST